MKHLLIRITFVFVILLSQQAGADVTFVESSQNNKATIEFIGSNSASDTGSNLVITLPAGMVANDIMVVQIATRGNPNSTIPTPTGWTQIDTQINIGTGGNRLRHAAFYKFATAGDISTGSITWAFGEDRVSSGGVSVFRNVDTTDPIDDSTAFSSTSNTTTIPATGFTTSVDGVMLVGLYAVGGNPTFTPPAGFNERYEESGGTSLVIMGSDAIQATAGASGNKTATLSSGFNRRSAYLVGLTPSTTTFTLPVPTGTIANDVMIASIAFRPSSVTITAPSGWTLIRQVTQGSGNTNKLATYYRVAGGSEPSYYTWTFSAAHTGAVGGAISLRGADTSDPIDDEDGQATGLSTNHTALDVTANVNGSMLVTAHALSSSVTWTTPTGMTEEVDVASLTTPDTVGISMEMNYETRATAGATGNRTAAAAAEADVGATQSVTIKPPAGFNHIRIQHDGEGLTCNPETVTVRACNDSTCSSEYAGSVTTTLSPTGWVGGDTITFTGNTTAQLRRTTVSTVALSSGSTTPTVSAATRCFNGATETCNMDFVESGFIFDVPDLTACKTSADVTITAVKTSNTSTTCVPAFESGTRTINFWSTYSNPNSGTQQVSVNGTAIDTDNTPGTNINLAFTTGATTTITVHYPDAGQMQLNASYTGSGSETGLAMAGSDQFVAVPVGLAVYSSSASCTASDATGPICAAAGASFDLNVKAACWTADGDTDFSDNPATPNFELDDIAITHTRVLPDPGADGNIGTSSFDFVDGDNGVHVISQTISEVGIFTFTATPPAYFGNTITAATSPNVGRFRPDHFRLSGGTLTPRISEGCAPASTFTYMDENLELGFTLTAENTGNTTTENYEGAFAKLDPTDAGDLDFGAIDTAAPTPLSARLTVGTIPPATAWNNGAVNVLAPVTIARAASPDGPYQALLFGVAPDDGEGVTLSAASLNLNVDNAGGNDHRRINNDAAAAPADVRYGRIFQRNAFGSELLPLTIPLQAEYYNGTQFIRNTNDSCTDYTSAGITFANRTGLAADPTASGSGTFISGSFDPTNPVRLNSANQVGSIDAIINVPAYLHYDWLTDGNQDGTEDDDPVSKATFGIHSGPDNNQIYIQEVY
jgi:hypothetical protein